jgi:hypothetical protein
MLTYLLDDWKFDNSEREVALCQFIFGPDMIRSLKRIGLLPPRDYLEFEKFLELHKQKDKAAP